MPQIFCDACGKQLKLPGELRYELRIELKAVHDPQATAQQSLDRDYRAEIAALLRQLNEMPVTEIQDHIHRNFRFLLCACCQRRYIENPLPQYPA